MSDEGTLLKGKLTHREVSSVEEVAVPESQNDRRRDEHTHEGVESGEERVNDDQGAVEDLSVEGEGQARTRRC